LNGRGKAETTLKRQLANIDASGKKIISTIPTGIDIMVSLSQEFTKINPGNFVITTVNGTNMVMNTNQVLIGLEAASRYILLGGILVEGALALSGVKDAQQNFWSDSMVSIALYTISVAGCGVPALVLGIGWVMYRNGAFDGMFDIKYHQNDYIPKTTPQDAIRPQYQFKDRYQPIYFHY